MWSTSIQSDSHTRVNRNRVLSSYFQFYHVSCNCIGGLTCTKDMAVNWTDIEVFHLIGSWSEVGIQEQLEGCKQYKRIYARLSTLLEERNINKTESNVEPAKVKKLCQEYKKIKDNSKTTGGRRIEWKYFDKLDEILAARPATPPVLVETLKPVVSDSDETDIAR